MVKYESLVKYPRKRAFDDFRLQDELEKLDIIRPVQPVMGFEASGLLYPLLSRGKTKIVTGNNPAAGTNASDSVPRGEIWRLESYQIELVTVLGSTAAPRLIVETPTRIRKWIGGLQDAHAGVETQTHVWVRGNGALPDATPTPFTDTEAISVRAEIPYPLYLFPARATLGADVIRTLTAGTFQATDDYGSPQISVEFWEIGEFG